MITRTKEEILEFFGIEENSIYFIIAGEKEVDDAYSNFIFSENYPITDMVGILESTKTELLYGFIKTDKEM